MDGTPYGKQRSYEPPPVTSAPRVPKSLSFGNSSFDSPPRKPKNLSFSKAAGLPKRKDTEQEKQEKLLEEIKSKMGTFTFPNGQMHKLTSFSELENIHKIGSGICGEVFSMRHRASGVVMAAKKMVWVDDHEERKRILMDLHVMTSHRSPYIVQYYGSIIHNSEVWVFMELMDTCLDRLLRKHRQGLPEEIICKMTVSIVKALLYLKEKHSVIHRDVKPSNFLLDKNGNVKLCDFGISGRLVDSQAFTRGAGAAAYMAPERISISSDNKGYDIRADVWSLGISLVELATGSLPYASCSFATEFELLTHIVDAPPPLPDRARFSDDFYDFMAKCLTKPVDQRPYYNELLKHPLIVQYQYKSVNIAAWYTKACSS